MNNLIRKVLGESMQTPMEVIEATRPVVYDVCPHCNQEIYERHVRFEGMDNDKSYHSDCDGAIIWPPKRVRMEHQKLVQAAKDPKHPAHWMHYKT